MTTTHMDELSEDQLFDLLRNKELDWHLDDELLRVIEQLATPVEGEEEFRESLRAKLYACHRSASE